MSGDDLRALSRFLRGRYGSPHEHHERIDSTNDRALAWLREGAPHGAVVTADVQTSGRGRRGRQWECGAGDGLLVSLILRPGSLRDPQRFGALGLAVGVGLHEGLPRLREAVTLKWPNDLLVGGRKLGGILCEARWIGDSPEVVVGFGLNVRPGAVPEGFGDRATCLETEGAAEAEVARAPLLASLLVGLEHAIEPFFARGFEAVRERYLRWSAVLGREVAFGDMLAPEGAAHGIAERLDDDGALWIRPPDGPAQRIESADVWLVPSGP